MVRFLSIIAIAALAAGCGDEATSNVDTHDAHVSADAPPAVDAGTPHDSGTINDDAGSIDAGPQRNRVDVATEIPGDCSTDATEQLQAAFDALAPGDTLYFPERACYRVDRLLELRGSDLVIEGRRSKLMRPELSPPELRYPRHNGFVALRETTDITIRELDFEGTNTGDEYGGSIVDSRGVERGLGCEEEDAGCYTVALEFEHGVELIDTERTVLESLNVSQVWGDGVYVSGGDEIEIRDVTVEKNGRQGMAIVDNTSNVLIDGAHIVRSRRSCFDLEPNSGDSLISHVEIRNTEMRCRLFPLASGGAGGEVSHVHFHHNTVHGGGGVFSRGTAERPRTDWVIEDIVVTGQLGTPVPVMRFMQTTGIVVRRVSLQFNPLRTGQVVVGLQEHSSATIDCSHFENAAHAATTDETSTVTETNVSQTADPPPCLASQ